MLLVLQFIDSCSRDYIELISSPEPKAQVNYQYFVVVVICFTF